MNPVRRELCEVSRERDAARVVDVLQWSGPLSLGDLAREPDLAPWSGDRIERAVVQAWSDSLISVDALDRLVAL